MAKPPQHPSDVIDALELLADQHAELDELFEQIGSATSDKRRLFAELADKLAAHATIEEKLFYPAVMSKQTEQLLRDAVDDHLEIKRMLAELLELEPDDAEFDEVMAELEQAVGFHAHDHEEGRLFPIARALLDDDQRAGLGNELLAMFDALMAEAPREHVPDETDAPAPLPAP